MQPVLVSMGVGECECAHVCALVSLLTLVTLWMSCWYVRYLGCHDGGCTVRRTQFFIGQGAVSHV